jgi:hypothetical protein
MTLTKDYQKSPLSGNGGCILARRTEDGNIELADTKNPDKPPFVFTPREWLNFLGGVRETNTFDL